MSKKIRFIMPQWQGGNRIQYSYGTRLLEWLSPDANCETVEIPISMELEQNNLRDGIAYKDTLLAQTKNTLSILKKYNPEQLVVYGGECSVSLAPFSYLLEKYPDDTGVLWFDRHADISVAGETTDYHAMVVSSLLGDGDPDFSDLIPHKLTDKRLLYIGVNDEEQFQRKICPKYQFKNIPPEDFEQDSGVLLEAVRQMNVKRLLLHIDLDVLDLSSFRSQSSANPEVYFERLKTIHPGVSFQALSRALNDINKEFDILCISLAEYLPWDIMNLKKLLSDMPLLT